MIRLLTMTDEPLIHDMLVGDYITWGQYLWRYRIGVR